MQKEFTTADEMLDLVVGSAEGAPVYLRDVATVTDTREERAQEVYTDRELGGMIMIQKQSGPTRWRLRVRWRRCCRA